MDSLYTHQETVSAARLLDTLINKFPNDEHIIMFIMNNSFSTRQKVTEEIVKQRIKKLNVYKSRLEELKARPQIKQRSQEWYDVRKSLITASDFAQALGEGKFGTQKQIFQKKCGYEEEKFNASIPPLKWGIMFEPVASDIYAQRFNCTLYEFGLLKHPTISHFGASPDGITDNGIMVEIKCPFKRKITGEVPLQYYYQIQGQLDVCNLDECDYLECEFKEIGEEDFFNNDSEKEKGIIIEYETEPEVYKYIYSNIYLKLNDEDQGEIKKWIDDNIASIQESSRITVHYWNLEILNVVRIFRNQDFIDEKLEMLKSIWDKIEEYKVNYDLYSKEISIKAKDTKTKKDTEIKLTGYSFI